jgi:alpha,alpha-trehalose phosphorylase
MDKPTTKPSVYTPDPWNIIEEFSGWGDEQRESYYRGESIFALGNGNIGMRGSFEEGLAYAVHPNDAGPYRAPDGSLQENYFLSVPGTYLNGFYESEKIQYPEPAYGYAKNSQTMLNVPDGKIIRVMLGEGDPLHIDLNPDGLKHFRRTLNLQTGLLERHLTWCSPHGREVELTVKRLVSLEHPNIAAIEFTLTPQFAGRVTFESVLHDRVQNVSVGSDPRVGSHLVGCVLDRVANTDSSGEDCVLIHRTKHSGLMLASGMRNVLTSHPKTKPAVRIENDEIAVTYTVQAKAGAPITLVKYLVYSYAEADSARAETLMADARAQLELARSSGFAGLAAGQSDTMRRFWARADVNIKGKGEDTTLLQQGIRFNMFHLLQAARADNRANICSKGLTGEGYEGHYFWDTEMFAAPFFQYAEPDICRNLLQYRYRILKYARQRARELSHKQGAAYAWRTINGEECSAFFPAGTAQYHINADIAYAIKSYVAASGDTQFLIEQGAEMVFETARLWVDLGDYVPARGNQFCIHGVTGPDEYTAVVDNNCYTNLMAQENLRYACAIARWLKANHPLGYTDVAARLKPPLAEEELSAWERAADAMYIPYDEQTGLFAQDDGFFNRAAWRWDWGSRDGKPVLLNRFHYLVIYRHQVCKQADTILALYLLPHMATLEQKRRNYNYYEQITTQDSSLSTCTFSIIASEIGYHRRAYDYFMQTARMDLDDRHGNVVAGVHIANMAGTWMCLVNGFAGLRLETGEHPDESIPHYKPYLPEEWDEYSFRVRHRNSTLQVTVKRDEENSGQVVAEYALDTGEAQTHPLKLRHHHVGFTLDEQNPKRVLVITDEIG